MNQLSKPRDVVAGGVVALIGVGFFALSISMDIGTASQMGPGYFPVVLSTSVIVLGLFLLIKATVANRSLVAQDRIPFRKLCLVIGSVLFFGLAVRGLGYLPTTFVVTSLAASASKSATLREVVTISVTVALLCYVVFIVGLRVPLSAMGPWITF